MNAKLINEAVRPETVSLLFPPLICEHKAISVIIKENVNNPCKEEKF